MLRTHYEVKFFAALVVAMAVGSACNDVVAAVYFDGHVWDRSAEFDPGSPDVLGSTNNTSTDSEGSLVWRHRYSTGGDFTFQAGAKWYHQTGTDLTWDPAFFASPGAWTRGDNVAPLIRATSLQHANQTSSASFAPLAQWINPIGNTVTVRIDGDLTRGPISGTNNYDYAVVWYDSSLATFNNISIGSRTAATTAITTLTNEQVTLDPGDFIQFGIRSHSTTNGNFVTLIDNDITITLVSGGATIPEPSAITLVFLGLLSAIGFHRRRRHTARES